jgi:diacylglycerol O-acyltransferase
MFLLLERRHAPFHVGALSLFHPPEGAPPNYAAALAERLSQQTHVSIPFNRRLAGRAGMNYWARDPHFDLAHHFVHLALPKPGRIRELLAMVSRMHSAHLDRAYPLWCTYLIEGLEDGRIATYTKVHHSMVDGVAGIRLMLKSMSPDAIASAEMPPPWSLKPSCRRTSTLSVPAVTGFRALTELALQGRHSVPAVFSQISRTVKDYRARHPDLVTSFQAPRCIFNQHISGSRRFAAESYSTARIKAVAERFDSTTNDAVLALCASALRRYLIEQNALPDQPLIAAVPVSIRRDDSEEGNEISIALVNLATHLSDPVERFMLIKRSMDYNKARFSQMSPAQLLAYTAAMLAPGLMTLLPGVKHAAANVVISHVPGPREPMYWQGCRLDGIYPVSLLLDGFALNITLIRRHDKVDFGLLACRRSVPQMQHLLGYIGDALSELEAVGGLSEPMDSIGSARQRA